MKKTPVVMFVYNRINHTRQSVKALSENEGAGQTDLIIFSDAPKSKKDLDSVALVREYIKDIKGFKSLYIVLRDKNYGMAKNIIEGLNEISEKHPQFIVVEDDIVTSPYFLNFMNEALELYKKNKKVWHISGFDLPISSVGLDDTFLTQDMHCWGWATWSDRWCHFDNNPDRLISTFSSDDIRRFDNSYADFKWQTVLDCKKGWLNTWDVFWYSTIFVNDGLCLSPTEPFVKNIGFDGSGHHRSCDYPFEINITKRKKNNLVINEQNNKKALELVRELDSASIIRIFFKKVRRKYIPPVIRKPLIKTFTLYKRILCQS